MGQGLSMPDVGLLDLRGERQQRRIPASLDGQEESIRAPDYVRGRCRCGCWRTGSQVPSALVLQSRSSRGCDPRRELSSWRRDTAPGRRQRVVPAMISDPLAARYMTPEQVLALVERARSRQDAQRRRASVARWVPANRKLSDAAVVAIREARAAGMCLASIASEHGVTVATVSQIARGETRKGAGGPVSRETLYARRR